MMPNIIVVVVIKRNDFMHWNECQKSGVRTPPYEMGPK